MPHREEQVTLQPVLQTMDTPLQLRVMGIRSLREIIIPPHMDQSGDTLQIKVWGKVSLLLDICRMQWLWTKLDNEWRRGRRERNNNSCKNSDASKKSFDEKRSDYACNGRQRKRRERNKRQKGKEEYWNREGWRQSVKSGSNSSEEKRRKSKRRSLLVRQRWSSLCSICRIAYFTHFTNLRTEFGFLTLITRSFFSKFIFVAPSKLQLKRKQQEEMTSKRKQEEQRRLAEQKRLEEETRRREEVHLFYLAWLLLPHSLNVINI
tara:strand:+ start:174 stop:962 length:789 start_codon:yes stop_codon:yes gene_type:complete